MLYKHYCLAEWDFYKWPNFSPGEPNIACPCCGEFFLDRVMFNGLQNARDAIKAPLIVNSGHRCKKYNPTIKGSSSKSEHLRLAFDISTRGHNRFELLYALIKAGFTSFGFYETFIHADRRHGRIWYGGKGAKKIWLNI